MEKHWRIRSQRYLLENPWLKIRLDRVETARGVTIEEYPVIEAANWVAICCLTRSGELVLVEQYRHGLGRLTLELPAGAIDPGESPEEAAQRELLEETGYRAERWVDLGHYAPEPTRHGHIAYLFLAMDAELHARPTPEATEDIELRLLRLKEVGPLIDSGELVHAVHVAALLLATRRGYLPIPGPNRP